MYPQIVPTNVYEMVAHKRYSERMNLKGRNSMFFIKMQDKIESSLSSREVVQRLYEITNRKDKVS